jgi:hypothetical protein
MKLRQNQLAWIEALEAHPERQHKGKLGSEKDGMCCLAQGADIVGMLDKPYGQDFSTDGNCNLLSSRVVKALGLRSEIGGLSEKVRNYYSLSSLNDYEMSWPEIAKLMRERPEIVFIESK